ncbi:transcriptional regulator [Nitzschia inconspicua]|uniref:Transcriptional regulator n=1 Tax=Nitzschia inconspicua TaxID=303405 RepID=A0A9K3PIN7_9STRA|nr:transcriptional regulator [Nitzschia inconspicua]
MSSLLSIGRIQTMAAGGRCSRSFATLLYDPKSSPSIIISSSQPNQQRQQQQNLSHPISPMPFSYQRRTMAGHNKWSKIRHKKGAKDVKRANIFGKASKSLTAASRDCNGDVTNLRLQAAIAHAKAVQLPKDKLEEAIEKGTTAYRTKKGAGADLENLRFDAMMRISSSSEETTDDLDSAQVACIILALSDNRNRTTQQIRHLVTKTGGELLPTDNLNYLFHQVGVILVEQPSIKDEKSTEQFEEELLEAALEAGAINVEELPLHQQEEESENDEASNDETANESLATFVVTTEERDLWQVVQALQSNGYQISQFQHRYVLQDEEHGGVDLSPDTWKQFEEFIDKLEDLEDVNHVYHNAN